MIKRCIYLFVMLIATLTATAAEGKVSGQLLANWIDNSNWADIRVVYAVTQNQDGTTQTADIQKLQQGYCQFYRPLPAGLSDGNYRITFRAQMTGRAKVNIGIRQIGPPYRWFYKEAVPVGENMDTFGISFNLQGRDTAGAAIYFQIDGIGMLTLTDPVLAPVPADSKAEVKDNLFGTYHFRQGLPAAWSWHNCFSDGDQVRFTPQSDGLKINVVSGVMTSYDWSEQLTLFSAPMRQVPLGKDLVCTFDVKGNAAGQLLVRCDKTVIAERPFTLNTGMVTPISVAFAAQNKGIYTAELKITGQMTIQGAYAGEAQRGKAASQLPDVQLNFGSGDAAAGGIFFADEQPQMRLGTLNAPSGAAVRLTLTDIYNQQQQVKLPATDQSTVLLNQYFTLKMGPARLEAVLTDADGEAIAPAAEQIIHRLERPVYWGKDAPDSVFGIHVQPVNKSLRTAKALGANFARLHDAGVQLLGWAYLERKPSEWTFDDAGVKRYRQHHLLLIGEFTTAPSFASSATQSAEKPPTLQQSVTSPYFLPLSLADYQKYCETIIERYGRDLYAVDVWNEPWLPLFYHTNFVKTLPPDTKRWASFMGGYYISPDDPAAGFWEMQKIVNQTVKNRQDDVKVLGINTTDSLGSEGRVPGKEFSGRMRQLGAVNDCDKMVYHQYTTKLTGFPGDEVETGYGRAIGPLLDTANNPLKPVWLTEGSPLSDPCDNFYLATTPNGGNATQFFDEGDRIVRFVTSLLAQHNQKVFLYSMGLHNGYGTLNPHRLMITAAGETHPAADAYANLTHHLEDHKFVKRITVNGNLHCYLFAKGDHSAAVLLPDPNLPVSPAILPANDQWAVKDLFGNPANQVKTYAVFVSGAQNIDQLIQYLQTVK